jgi:GTPase SAR1 family protein
MTFWYEASYCQVPTEDGVMEFEMWDSPGQEDYDRMRPLCYPGTHVILIMFNKTSPDSLDNVLEKVRSTAFASSFTLYSLSCNSRNKWY